MNKKQIIEHLNQYVDQIVEQHKFELFFDMSKVRRCICKYGSNFPNLEYTLMTGKTVTGGYTVEIFDRQGEREPQRMSCTCADWTHRLKKQQKPCKHIFAFVERYQAKRKYLLEKAMAYRAEETQRT